MRVTQLAFDNMPDWLGYAFLLGRGAIVTSQLTVLGCCLALIVAFVLGMARLSKFRPINLCAAACIEFFRGTSVLVQLFWIFYALPLFGIRLDPFPAAILALGLNVGSYGAEVVRGAILAVPRSQFEAGTALNLGWWQLQRRVILPQALLAMLPSFGNLAIDLLKATALCSLITISDLTFQAHVIRAATGLTAGPFLSAVIIYLIIASVMIFGIRRLESRMAIGIEVQKRN